MPELPEVETIKLGLQKHLVGYKIENVEIREKKIFQGDTKNIIGAKVTSVKRAGKGLIIELDNDYVMPIHLKLTGQIIYSKGQEKLSEKVGGELPNKWTRVIFKLKSQSSNLKATAQKSKLKSDSYLYFNDVRKFGWIKVVKKDEIQNLPFFKELGPEFPVTNLSKNNLTIEQFNNIISRSNIPIKVLLMDQKKIAGVGNIYANEALFLAGIDPRRKSKSLSENKIKKLYESILEVLKRGIKYGGSSDVNFVNALGEDGHYQNHFLVYARKGERCLDCGGIVRKVMLRGRGTYFCARCQK